MKLVRPLFQQILDDTIELFSKKILPLPNKVEVRFQSKDEYMEAVKSNPLIQQQIQFGFYTDIEKEYVGFAVVYAKDKFEMKKLLGLPYIITICDEIAKEVLKPFTSTEVKAYLTHVYLHEMTHIFDKWLKEMLPDVWESCLSQTNGNEQMANELFAEHIPALAMGDKSVALYKDVEKKLWSKIFNRMEQIRKQRGL
ncbi:hypothetical protein BSK59_16270 [Paenibacillus odorifer]|uniref:hypothetical protein n=1 Tax=Paenibacillus odorifer TaxID=189426 RepID=UPI00096FB1F2|nr:hypothetical protein [Paenibacillus odorifer]OME54134.1 hypothetical protein BSK59_16270 [Paenibacillus odorifer]